jgi:hypothetical protein
MTILDVALVILVVAAFMLFAVNNSRKITVEERDSIYSIQRRCSVLREEQLDEDAREARVELARERAPGRGSSRP